MKMRRKFPSHKKENVKKKDVLMIQAGLMKRSPKPRNDEGLERFLRKRILFYKRIRRLQFKEDKFRKQRTILSHGILGLEFLLYEWEKIK